MPSNWSRRDALATVGTAFVAATAGCSSSDDDPDESPTPEGTPYPDAGTDTYGILLENRDDDPHEVAIEVTIAFEEDNEWEETVEVEGGETRHWTGVLEGEEEYAVRATLEDDDLMPFDRYSDRLWITPESETAPDVRNVEVIVDREEEDGEEEDGEDDGDLDLFLDVTYRGEHTPTPTPRPE